MSMKLVLLLSLFLLCGCSITATPTATPTRTPDARIDVAASTIEATTTATLAPAPSATMTATLSPTATITSTAAATVQLNAWGKPAIDPRDVARMLKRGELSEGDAYALAVRGGFVGTRNELAH